MASLNRRIPARDPRLGRHINHDERSRRYPYRAAPRRLTSVTHHRYIPVLDQGQLGSCTGNAGIGCLGTDPFYGTVPSRLQPLLVGLGAYPFTEAGAVELYSDATAADDYPGQYPPDDTGSDGLTIAKVLTAHGLISGYEHAFGIDQALQALMDRPLITGTNWYDGMFNPTAEGLVTPTGPVAGGHEYVADGYDAARGWVWFTNSWGTGWGQAGRFAMEAAVYGRLLDQDGDVTVFTPVTAPAPQPEPDADRVFADALRRWSKHPRLFGSARLKAAGADWLKAKEL